MPGRPRDPIWGHFQEVLVGQHLYARCTKCEYQLVGKPLRMKKHFEKCCKLTTPANQHAQENQLPDPVPVLAPVQPQAAKRMLEDPDIVAPPPKRHNTQPHIDNHITKTDQATTELLHMELAKLFFGCNIPFTVIEHPLFLSFMRVARPGYVPPNRKQLADKYLDKVHEGLQTTMAEQLQGKVVTLVEDGWSNIRNEPVIATCVQTHDKTYFIDATDTGSMPKTGANCASLAKENIIKAERDYGCSVKSVCTDNAANMDKMRKTLVQDDPSLIVYGCSAHWGNLLGQDITPTNVTKFIVEIQKYFRNHHLPAAWLAQTEGSIRPALPCDVRWKSQDACLESFIRNRPFYMEICQDHDDDIDKTIVSRVMDYNLFTLAKELKAQLSPISQAIDIFQSNSTGLAKACDTWIALLDNPVLEQHKQAIKKRFTQAVTPSHFAAYMTNPVYKGSKLTQEQRDTAMDWLAERNQEFIECAVLFEAQATPYPGYMFKATNLHPVIWWTSLKRTSLSPAFIDLMIALHTATASSASIERVFSTFSLIHSKLRNRLGVKRAAKLVFCFRMLRGKDDLDY